MTLKSPRELKLMRKAGEIVAEVLMAFEEHVAPGVTTAELDAVAAEIIAKYGAISSFRGVPATKDGFPAFPAVITACINEEIVHGIPGPRRLREGDIVSLDVGAIYQGYHGDAAVTLPVGEINSGAQRLLEVTKASLYAGIAQALPGGRLWDVIRAIQKTIESNGFGVIREYQGHGIGRTMWEPPSVPNFLGYGGPSPTNFRLRPGMTLALEPMVVAGDWHTEVLSDGWTVVTADRSLSAHFEHTIAVTDNGPVILTRPV
ncbi:MAG: type I methionyl aminopeptidase [Anaerolineae bacterium]